VERNWAELSPEEKRERRFRRWLSPPHVKFSSPEAEKAYKERATRLMNAFMLKVPDRVPVMLPAGNFPAYYAGTDLKTVMYDYDKLRRAWIKFLHDFDMDTYRGPGLVHPGKVLEILDYKLYKWPGHGIASDVKGYQFVEGEYMMADEYDALIRDPSDFAIRVFIPRVVGALEPFRKLARFSSLLGMPIRFVSPATEPDVQAAFQAIVDAGKEMAKWREAVNYCNREADAAGFPSMTGGMGVAPFDTIGDSLRGTQGIILDMYRQPDKLLEAMEKMADLTIENAIATANETGGIMVSFPLHKGDDTFMSDEQFETFYWPTLKKVILALINEGLMVFLFAEGRYGRRLETIKDLPRGWTIWHFDQTDMAKAKKVLGDTACIAGNVPTSLMCTGTPQDVREICRKLIEVCGRGGGYLLTGGAAATEVREENLHAMMEAAKEYGVYK
jgi:uroporphyrinogen-III decarboxylase